MRTAALAFFSVLGSAAAQGVTGEISPSTPSPPGCTGSFDGNFQVQVITATAKRDLPVKKEKRQRTCGGESTLVASLRNGVLTDRRHRTGYIASNYQLQFDAPPQAGAIYTAGFSICQNRTLALGGSAVWWACVSGSFYNLYDRDWAAHCSPAQIEVLPCTGGGSSGSDSLSEPNEESGNEGGNNKQPGEGEQGEGDGKGEGDGHGKGEEEGHGKGEEEGQQSASPASVSEQASATPAHMCQIEDGQVQGHVEECEQAPQSAPVSQSSEGQVVATSVATAAPQGAPVSQSSEGQVVATSVAPVSQSSEGQVVATSVAPVSQSSEGQVVATSEATAAPQGAPVSQSSEGQVVATSVAPVSQSSEGQVVATSEATAAPQSAPVSQSSEGQVVATSVAPVSQSSEGQVVATSEATAAPQSAPVSQSNEGQVEATSQVSAAPQSVGQEETKTHKQESASPASVSEAAPAGKTGGGEGQSGSPGSAAQESVAQTNSAASTFSINWGSRSVTASVTPAWLGGAGSDGAAVAGGRLIGSAPHRYELQAAYAQAIGILGMMFWVV